MNSVFHYDCFYFLAIYVFVILVFAGYDKINICVYVCLMTDRELRIRPSGETFTKPVGGSVVMTCSLEAADNDEVDDDLVLSWSDNDGQEVTSVTGRYKLTAVPKTCTVSVASLSVTNSLLYTLYNIF